LEELNNLGYNAIIGIKNNFTKIYLGKPAPQYLEGIDPEYDFKNIVGKHRGAVYYAGGNIICGGIDDNSTQEVVNLLIKKLS
jgi:hypothetical protein